MEMLFVYIIKIENKNYIAMLPETIIVVEVKIKIAIASLCKLCYNHTMQFVTIKITVYKGGKYYDF